MRVLSAELTVQSINITQQKRQREMNTSEAKSENYPVRNTEKLYRANVIFWMQLERELFHSKQLSRKMKPFPKCTVILNSTLGSLK